jgi:hypothetical protein
MRPPRPRSPRSERQHAGQHHINNRTAGSVQRRPDAGTDEMIRFVREFQLEKQPTLMRLQRRAPLPGIGQSATTNHDGLLGARDSRILVRDAVCVTQHTDLDDSDSDDQFDSEVLLAAADRSADPRNDPTLHAFLAQARGGHGIGSESVRVHQQLLSRSMPGFSANRSISSPTHGPGSTGHHQHYSHRQHNGAVQPRHATRHAHAHAHRHGTVSGRNPNQLPPLQRDELPDRPSAPFPSRTPPLLDMDEDYMAEEPFDYIDPA